MATGSKKDKFSEVLNAELDALGVKDKSDNAYSRAYNSTLCGLAFSGGGIRSATFNLGVIQGLAKQGFLSKFDYLSTVSGGGYIGSWLSALLQRSIDGPVDAEAVDRFQSRLTTHPCKNHEKDCPDRSGFDDPLTSGFPPVEHAAVRFLRGYSNYLTPRLGLSGDVLALVSLFLRNVILVQIVLALLLLLVLLTPYFFATITSALNSGPNDMPIDLRTVLYIGLFLILFSLYSCGRLLTERKRIATEREAANKGPADKREQRLQQLREKHSHAAATVVVRIILPFAFAAWLVITGIADDDSMPAFLTSEYVWAGLGALAYVVVWAIGFAISRVRRDKSDSASKSRYWVVTEDEKQPLFSKKTAKRLRWLLGAAALAGAALGYLLFEGTSLVHSIVNADPINIWRVVGFGPPIAMLGVSFVVTLHIGASRDAFTEHDREWWARLGGFALIVAIGWAALFAIVIYAPPFLYWLGNGGLVAVAAWLVSSGVGAWFARGASPTNGEEQSVWKSAVIKLAPWLFIVGLLVILSGVVYGSVIAYSGQSLQWLTLDLTFVEAMRISAEQQAALRLRHALLPMGAVLVILAITVRVFDINIFSAHSLYKNRLTRAYLGASRAGEREPHPFTGFDPEDDLDFADLQGQRPIHIVNTTINMTGGDDLAWQTRRAASFPITPFFAGYQAKSTQGVRLGDFRPTSEFAGGMQLGTAMAISGAAASPNMGYHTSASVAGLLTAFNFRLGFWAGNPTSDTEWREASPKLSIRPILSEVTGSAKADSPWINLTDGGHFDNLGVYELIRRRCKLIVVTDAGCDREHTFEDLANMIRKCWTDFGVHIDFESLKDLYLDKESKRFCKSQFAIGKIVYPEKDKRSKKRVTGLIVYVKCSLTKEIHDKYPDIGQYADSHNTFPHETTIDQFFNENQFEAYRHLGFIAATEAIKKPRDEAGSSERATARDYLTVWISEAHWFKS